MSPEGIETHRNVSIRASGAHTGVTATHSAGSARIHGMNGETSGLYLNPCTHVLLFCGQGTGPQVVFTTCLTKGNQVRTNKKRTGTRSSMVTELACMDERCNRCNGRRDTRDTRAMNLHFLCLGGSLELRKKRSCSVSTQHAQFHSDSRNCRVARFYIIHKGCVRHPEGICRRWGG